MVDSPSIVAIDRTTNKIIATGNEASMMHGKTHENIKTIRPLKDGVIADFNASEQMINTAVKHPTQEKILYPFLKNGYLHSLQNYRSGNESSKRISRPSQWQKFI